MVIREGRGGDGGDGGEGGRCRCWMGYPDEFLRTQQSVIFSTNNRREKTTQYMLCTCLETSIMIARSHSCRRTPALSTDRGRATCAPTAVHVSFLPAVGECIINILHQTISLAPCKGRWAAASPPVPLLRYILRCMNECKQHIAK
jgi:hypothetical protein